VAADWGIKKPGVKMWGVRKKNRKKTRDFPKVGVLPDNQEVYKGAASGAAKKAGGVLKRKRGKPQERSQDRGWGTAGVARTGTSF